MTPDRDPTELIRRADALGGFDYTGLNPVQFAMQAMLLIDADYLSGADIGRVFVLALQRHPDSSFAAARKGWPLKLKDIQALIDDANTRTLIGEAFAEPARTDRRQRSDPRGGARRRRGR